MAGGFDNLLFPSEESYAETTKIIKAFSSVTSTKEGEADLQAMMRLMDKLDDSYKDLYV